MESIENEHSADDPPYQLFKTIARYSLYEEEPDLRANPELRVVWPLLCREIDASVEKRKRGFIEPEVTVKQKDIVDLHINAPALSQRELAEALGVSKTTVNHALKKFADNPALFGYAVRTGTDDKGRATTEYYSVDPSMTAASVASSFGDDSYDDAYGRTGGSSGYTAGTGTLIQSRFGDWQGEYGDDLPF